MKGICKGIGAISILASGIFSSAYADSAKDVVAVGPVDLVQPGSITVMGRQFKIEDTSGISAGDKVAVHGALQADGSASNARADVVGTYVPGADTVYETGVVTKVDTHSGHLSIGDSDVDYTATLAAGSDAIPSVGQLVAIEGTQPTLGGVILGSTTTAGVTAVNVAIAGASRSASYKGTTGTGRASISGSDSATSSISGSDSATSSISGSDSATASISGSDSATG